MGFQDFEPTTDAVSIDKLGSIEQRHLGKLSATVTEVEAATRAPIL